MAQEKTLENLEVGDILANLGSTIKWEVVFVTKGGVGISNPASTSPYVYYRTVQYLKNNSINVEKPLSVSERAAKALLEAIGFRVTR